MEATLKAQEEGQIKDFLTQKNLSISMKLHHAEGFKTWIKFLTFSGVQAGNMDSEIKVRDNI